jgi:hypothetical protein
VKLSPKAQATLDRVVQQFRSGDLSPVVEIARMQRTGGPIPSDRWTWSKRLLVLIQTGTVDCRGYRQWQQAGRYVMRGAQAAHIFAPILVNRRDPKSGEQIPVLTGFKTIPVYPAHATEGEELPEVSYTPRELPPLADVAEKLGITVSYEMLPPDRYGDCTADGKQIRLGTHDPLVFFHELAHAVHARHDGGLKGGQHKGQEAIAEFSATVLASLFGYGDRTGNCWRYIQQYAKDPVKAVLTALGKVEEVLAFLLADCAGCASHGESPEEW